MQVEVHDVGAEIAGTHLAHQGVHVGAVHVHQRALGMQHVGNLMDLLLEDAQGVGIGEHQRGDVFVHLRFQRRHVDHARGVRLQVLHRVAAHRSGCGIGSVRRIGHQDFLARIALRLEIGPHQQDSGHLAVSTRGRLHGDGIHAGDLDELVAEHLDDAQARPAKSAPADKDAPPPVPSCARQFRSPARCTSWCRSPADTYRGPPHSSRSRGG